MAKITLPTKQTLETKSLESAEFIEAGYQSENGVKGYKEEYKVDELHLIMKNGDKFDPIKGQEARDTYEKLNNAGFFVVFLKSPKGANGTVKGRESVENT